MYVYEKKNQKTEKKKRLGRNAQSEKKKMRVNQKKGEEEADQSGDGKEGKEGEWCTGEQEEWVTLDPRDPSFQIGGFSPFSSNFPTN